MIAQGRLEDGDAVRHDDDETLLQEAFARLRAQPELLRNDPVLMAELTAVAEDGCLVDINRAARLRMEGEIRKLRATNDRLQALSRANLAAQAQTHAAALSIAEADTLEELDRMLAARVAGPLGLDVARVLIERYVPRRGARCILAAPDGLTHAALGDSADHLGPLDTHLANVLYGLQAPRLRSHALIALDIAGRPGLLCLASRGLETYTADQGADLPHFLGRLIERRIAPWLAS